MKTVKSLQDEATTERDSADVEHKDAQRHRENASKYKIQDDPQAPIRENEIAQKAEERAQRHEKIANELIEDATRVEAKAISLDRDAQTTQVTMQKEVDRLKGEAKRLRGE